MFLHADTRLGAGWEEEARRFLAANASNDRAAAFRFTLDDDSGPVRRAQFWARLRADVLKLPYGEQGLLISRRFYDALGGYRPGVSREDARLARRIGGARLSLLRTEAVASAELWRSRA